VGPGSIAWDSSSQCQDDRGAADIRTPQGGAVGAYTEDSIDAQDSMDRGKHNNAVDNEAVETDSRMCDSNAGVCHYGLAVDGNKNNVEGSLIVVEHPTGSSREFRTDISEDSEGSAEESGSEDVGSSIDGQEHILFAHEDAMHDPLDADFEAEYSHKDRAVSELSSGVVDGRCHVALYSGQCGLAQGEPGAECI